MKYIVWALPKEKTDRLDERPMTSFALTREQADKVVSVATEDGWHGFRLVEDISGVPDFAATIDGFTDRDPKNVKAAPQRRPGRIKPGVR